MTDANVKHSTSNTSADMADCEMVVALPPIPECQQLLKMEALKTYLILDLRCLLKEMAEHPTMAARHGGDLTSRMAEIQSYTLFIGEAGHWHFGNDALPSSRAELVLDAVGCGWRAA